MSVASSPTRLLLSKMGSAIAGQPIFILDLAALMDNLPPSVSIWDDEQHHLPGWQAFLEHSVQNYGPLPSELRPLRLAFSHSITSLTIPPGSISRSHSQSCYPAFTKAHRAPVPVLQHIPVNWITKLMSAATSLEALKPFLPLVIDVEPKRENAFGLAPGRIYGSQDGVGLDKTEHGQVVDGSGGECHWTRIGYDAR